MSPTKLTPDDVAWKDVVFKECTVHTLLRYAGDVCPVCKIIEERDLALGKADYEKTQLEGTIADLEEKIGSWGFKNGEKYPK